MEIINQTANRYGYSLQELTSRSRTGHIASVRGVLYVFLKFDLHIPVKEIGRLLNRNHSSVVTTANSYVKEVSKNKYLTDIYAEIQRIYHADHSQDQPRGMGVVECRSGDTPSL